MPAWNLGLLLSDMGDSRAPSIDMGQAPTSSKGAPALRGRRLH